MRRVTFALVDVPYAAVRTHLRAGESANSRGVNGRECYCSMRHRG